MSYDIAIIGAGPAGLSFARALSGHGLRIAIIDKQKKKTLADPAFDGRDLALTHRSKAILEELEVWKHIPQNEVSFIREARVLNGTSPYALAFDSRDVHKDALGAMISNHHIRRALYEEVKACKDVKLFDEAEVIGLRTDEEKAGITLSNGKTLAAKLLVAADSRFSDTRRKMGIPAAMHDFGRTVIVCRMTHEIPHDDVAFECFHYDRTLAVLPLFGNHVSVVITLPSDEVEGVLSMSEKDFNHDIAARFERRLGNMRLAGPRIAYPLVAVYAHRFHARRFALIGDAAVGMHPVTAHGFNFGLLSQQALSEKVLAAHRSGSDIGAQDLLAAYSRQHRRATRPLYLATNALVFLYTRTSAPAKLLRSALLVLGNRLAPARRRIIRGLTASAANPLPSAPAQENSGALYG